MSDINIENLVEDTQQKWASIVLEIGKKYKNQSDVSDLVSDLLHNIYAFDHCDILFKPTLAKNIQFRSKKEEFESYFLGQNKVCEEDTGFAIKDWQSIKFENYKIVDYNGSILAMGNYFFEDIEKKLLKVEYTFGFIRVNNQLKINLHHSSLPYDG